MGNNIFKFKQFEVDQTGCAMRINTDGVVLAAIINSYQPKSILEIGTGTGVIALMLAQRFKNSLIDAVEIDYQAAKTAKKNAENSVFFNQVNVYHSSIQDFVANKKYNLVVSNPPYFVNDLKNEEHRKGIARHADVDFFEVLLQKSTELLTEKGELWLILPVRLANDLISKAVPLGLSLRNKINVHSDKTKPAFRQVICLSKSNAQLQESDFYIYQSLNENTAEYRCLLKDFFLAF